MKDTRSFWQKLYKNDPRLHDLTPRGKWIQFTVRLFITIVVIGLYVVLNRVNPGNAWWLFLLILLADILILDRVDALILNHFTYEAEKAKMDKKVSETLAKAKQK